MTDSDFMREALKEARLAADTGELPVGCVIVKDGEILARGRNRCEALGDATAHAEMIAIREASRALHGWRLEGCTLYVTLEPCPMCAGAVMQARLDRLVYGAPNPAQGCAGSLYRIPEDPAFPHFCKSDGGVLVQDCQALLDAFFSAKRAQAPGIENDA